jgi:SAM-dependent methyltransferase
VVAAKSRSFRRYLGMAGSPSGRRRILEIGCSTGVALAVARDLGWEVHGLDLSGPSVAAARRRLPDGNFRQGELSEAGYAAGSFEAIACFDVVEHFPDPRGELERMRELLAPGGVLLGVVPDIRSLSGRLLRSRWFHFLEDHLYHFSPGNLRALLESCGFHDVSIFRAPKCVSLEMVYRHFTIHSHLGGARVVRAALSMVPAGVRGFALWVPCGQMGFIARKPALPAGGREA